MKRINIHLTRKKITTAQAKRTVKSIASFTDSVMDRKLIESNRYGWFFVKSDNLPILSGEYFIDRKSKETIKLDLGKKTDTDKWSGAKWHERLYVYESAITAIKEKQPLLIDVDCDYYNRDRLDLYSGSSSSFIAPAAKLD